MPSLNRSRNSRSLSVWLFLMLLLVCGIILLGGATRLTNSGLSITEWRPITGALPPLSHEAWLSEFEKYQKIPEFSAEHPDMDLKGFEFIYFMEWSHRQMGRLIGVLYLLPLIWFWATGRIPAGKKLRFLVVLLLIGLQGAVGWWMVKSGLVGDRVDVSQYRLAAHLGMAFLILSILFWTWRDHRQNWPARQLGGALRFPATFLMVLIYIQIIAGAFVAGTHAGLSYNTWPLMDGGFVPNGYFVMSPLWRNLFENVAAIQFNHRLLAYLVVLAGVWVWGLARKQRDAAVTRASSWLLVAIIAQITLGVITLLKLVDLPYALAHQGLAIIVFLLAVWTAHAARARAY